ncbi:MAG: ComEC/Rec2 family competence protein [Flavobacteriales bacterium]|nr:ComEC/Rec2 family competence protein [Flavobacteriales bacterium]
MWFNAPLFRLAIPLFIGYYLGYSLNSSIYHLALCLAVVLFLFASIKSNWNYSQRHLTGVVLLVASACLGLFAGNSLRRQTALPQSGPFQVEIGSDGRASERWTRYEATARNQEGQCESVWCYLPVQAPPLSNGQRIWIDAATVPLTPPAERGAFDFRAYSAQFGIYSSLFHRDSVIIWVDSTAHVQPVHTIRSALMENLRSAISGIRQIGILEALVLGQKDDLQDHDRTQFSRAGAMHILAVSGLHVGLVYGVVVGILGWILPRHRARWLRLILILLAIWLYAGITSFSPSVLRATIMLTFIESGNVLKRRMNSLNSLAASAITLLIFDMRAPLSLGFQLSYLAVCGILILYPWFEQLWKPKIRPLRWAWQLTGVSLAAQLFTLPISLHYFGFFPVYGIVGNLVIIPLSTLLLYSGLALALASDVPFLGGILAWCTEKLCAGLLYVIDFIASLPNAALPLSHLPMREAIVLLSVVVLITIWLRTAVRGWVLMGLAMVAIMCSFQIESLIKSHNDRIIVHSQTKELCISLLGGSTPVLIRNDIWSEVDSNVVDACWHHLYYNVNDARELMLDLKGKMLKIDGMHLQVGLPEELLEISSQVSFFFPGKDDHPDSEEIPWTTIIVLGKHLSFQQRKRWGEKQNTRYMQVWDLKQWGALEWTNFGEVAEE